MLKLVAGDPKEQQTKAVEVKMEKRKRKRWRKVESPQIRKKKDIKMGNDYSLTTGEEQNG